MIKYENLLTFRSIALFDGQYLRKCLPISDKKEVKLNIIISTIFLFILISCSTQRNPASERNDRINLIFDLDYTLVSPSIDQLDTNTVVVESERYRINDGAALMIEELANRPNVDIHFFSGGSEARNIELLKKIKTSTGRSLLSYSSNIYSFEDLTQVASRGRFSERYKKDLSLFELNLNRTILIDDNQLFAVSGQERNLLWLGRTYHHIEEYSQIDRLKQAHNLEPNYLPSSIDAWYLARNKLKFVNLLLNDAIESDLSDPGTFLEFINAKKNTYIPYEEIRTPHFDKLLKSPISKPCSNLVLSFP